MDNISGLKLFAWLHTKEGWGGFPGPHVQTSTFCSLFLWARWKPAIPLQQQVCARCPPGNPTQPGNTRERFDVGMTQKQATKVILKTIIESPVCVASSAVLNNHPIDTSHMNWVRKQTKRSEVFFHLHTLIQLRDPNMIRGLWVTAMTFD